MKTSVVAAVLTPAVAHAQWWGGAPDCAQGCFSSLWDSASTWPAPTSYCQATQAASVHGCIESACSATPTAVTSYSSLSSSLCAQWSSCSANGATGVYTISAPAFTGEWGPGKYGGPGGPGGRWRGDRDHDHDGDDDNDDYYHRGYDHDGDGDVDQDDYDEWTRTWTGGVYTVTGCEWNGNPWAGGPGGWGPGGRNGGSPWGPWGRDWTWSTVTKTITQVLTLDIDDGTTTLSTSVGIATVAEAASGTYTTTSLITNQQAQTNPTPTGGSNPQEAAAAGRADEMLAVKVMGGLLAGGLAVVGLL
ncbi:Extracellular membrane protein CFEM domain-containing protein [Madurella fahalii]|uniref:Extracellular membrane protein CFEM domain-containing protein n=1 Tax=Madurella fahalii TaxID=1157608 RepID=A0ABQ0G3B3_9PEZI